MSNVIRCEKCSSDNRMGQLFCRECGAKLDLSKMQAPAPGKKGGRNRNNDERSGISAARIVRIALTVALVTVLALLCIPAPAPGQDPSPQGARIVQAKMGAIRGAISRRNDVQEQFDVADINAHLQDRLVRPPTDNQYQLQLREVRIGLFPGGAQVWTKSTLGPLPLTHSTQVRIERGADGRHLFIADRPARIGRMPMIGPLRDRTLDQLIGVFNRMNEELNMLNRLPRVEVIDDAIIVGTTRAAN